MWTGERGLWQRLKCITQSGQHRPFYIDRVQGFLAVPLLLTFVLSHSKSCFLPSTARCTCSLTCLSLDEINESIFIKKNTLFVKCFQISVCKVTTRLRGKVCCWSIQTLMDPCSTFCHFTPQTSIYFELCGLDCGDIPTQSSL